MHLYWKSLLGIIIGSLLLWTVERSRPAYAKPLNGTTQEISFKTHDGYEMVGKLTLPMQEMPRAIVLYVQTAEGMTVDMKRSNGRGGTFNYFDLYREKLPPMSLGFFSYEGRGIRMGDTLPRYEQIQADIYNTSTLDNKVRDILSAIQSVRKQLKSRRTPIILMGASEGTLLAAEAASRAPREVQGLILYGVMSSNMRQTFRYIMTGGAFLSYRDFFDSNNDGKIAKAEFEADPIKFRERSLKNAPFEAFDRNGDGYFTSEEMGILTKVYLDAIEKEDFALLDQWGKTSAAVSLPKNWFKDHFAHPPIWQFLAKLKIPVAYFHGDRDASVPIEGLKQLEEQAKQARKTNMEFHYFKDLDHSLNIALYFIQGTLPAGHTVLFETLQRWTATK